MEIETVKGWGVLLHLRFRDRDALQRQRSEVPEPGLLVTPGH